MWTLKEQAEHNLGRLNSDLDAIRQTKAVARIYWAISLVFGAYIVSFIDKFQIVTSPDLLEISVGITFMVISASFLYANGLFFFMVLKSEEIFAPPRFHLFKNQVYDKVASSDTLSPNEIETELGRIYNVLLEELIDENYEILRKKRLWERRLIQSLSVLASASTLNFVLIRFF